MAKRSPSIINRLSPELQPELLEEVVALVIDEDEGREVLDSDLPDRLHSEFGIFNTLDATDAALREDSGDAADGAKIESSMLFASVSHNLGAVTLGNHDKRSSVILELIHIRIHSIGSRGAHAAARITFRSLGRTGVENGMILELGGHVLPGVQTGLKLRVGDVTGNYNGTIEIDPRAYRILRELGPD